MTYFRGLVRDLDFITNLDGCQVIITSGQGDDLIAVTREARLQAVLELAFATGSEVEVDFTEGQPNVLNRAKVNRDFIPSRMAPRVTEDDDPAAPGPGDQDRASEDEYGTAVERTNFGEAAEAPRDLAGGARARAAAPTLAIDPAALKQFVDACRTAGVTYGLGKKVPKHGAVPGTDFKKVDCSGFVREAIWRATDPNKDFPDGSVVQREHVQAKGFEHGTSADGLKQDGAVRIAFLRPQDVSSGIGHVVLIHNAKTFESHGGTGPDSRPWTNSGWQAKTLVYVLTPST